ncbi:MAG: replicative DNA helicase [Bacteroidota bacterium]
MESKKKSFSIVRSKNKVRAVTHALPHALDVEEAVLGALIMERDALTDVIDILSPQSFYREPHQLIYAAIVHLFNNTDPIDPRTLVNQLRKKGVLEKVGGLPYIIGLTESIISTKHIEHHARLLVEYAMRRGLITVSSEIQEEAYDPTVDTFELLDKSERALFEVSEANIRKNYEQIDSLMEQAIKELEAKKSNQQGVTGVSTSFPALDRMLLGWQKSDFIVIAARPGMGKTALMLTLLRNAAIDAGVPVAFFSLEMSSVQLVNRMISSETELESDKIRKGNLEEYEWEQLFHKTTEIARSNIYIDDTPALSLFEFRAKCRRLKAQRGIQVVFVDYLQLMVEDQYAKGGNREQQIAAISRGVKAIAKELDITIIVASQLSRSVETRGGDKRPQLSDLRESGAIEQDADVVLFLYRPEYYGLTQDEEGNDTRALAEIIIAKHRNGPTGKVILHYHSSITKFDNPSNPQDSWESKIFDQRTPNSTGPMNSF